MTDNFKGNALTYFLYAWIVVILGFYLFQFRHLIGPILNLTGLG
jgi:hypothetical protein